MTNKHKALNATIEFLQTCRKGTEPITEVGFQKKFAFGEFWVTCHHGPGWVVLKIQTCHHGPGGWSLDKPKKESAPPVG